jgi:tRNA threonylcarbamoyladenosine biosynthesis protein TsaE
LIPVSFFAKNDIYARMIVMAKNTFITDNPSQTRKLGEMLAEELRGGEVVCLTGDLGSGKTTFAQGVLKGLGAKGPYTSPTFLVMKHYHIVHNAKRETRNEKKSLRVASCELREIYHIDAYRVGPRDVLELGWEEIIANKKNVVIVEWAERIKSIIPKNATWLEFEHADGDERKIIVG